MNTDPIAEMLTRIRNATRARKARVDIPFSKLKLEVARVLKEEGYITDYREIAGKSKGQGQIELKLKYDAKHGSIIEDLQRVSRPGMRRYMKSSDIPKVRNGMGIMIMTTSKGLMTDRQARRDKMGGEALCAVW